MKTRANAAHGPLAEVNRLLAEGKVAEATQYYREVVQPALTEDRAFVRGFVRGTKRHTRQIERVLKRG